MPVLVCQNGCKLYRARELIDNNLFFDTYNTCDSKNGVKIMVGDFKMSIWDGETGLQILFSHLVILIRILHRCNRVRHPYIPHSFSTVPLPQ